MTVQEKPKQAVKKQFKGICQRPLANFKRRYLGGE